MILNENRLDEWVRGNRVDAQGVIVELVWRLVAASAPAPVTRRFPLGDSLNQPGPDGELETDFGLQPWVPEGRSYWEIGVGVDAKKKATDDYRDLTQATPEEIRKSSTFVFVTPLSGVREWRASWTTEDQLDWRETRRARGEWKSVKVIDGTQLIDWLHHVPAVELWLATRMGLPTGDVETLGQRWEDLRSIGDPPPLSPRVFLSSREAASSGLKDLLDRNSSVLRLEGRYPDQMADFVAAYVADLPEEQRVEAEGRCLVVGSPEAWNGVASGTERVVLVADAALDLSTAAGLKLLEKAKRRGHAVVYWSLPGGVPHPNRANLQNPTPAEVKEALEASGYPEERARTLGQKSGGNLGTLLRCVQNLSLMPEWSQGTAAAELAVAALLGSWDETSEADRQAVSELAGKDYGEWIGAIRNVALGPAAPLSHRSGTWRFVSRYEGWYSLGPHLFGDHLDRLGRVARDVLGEPDPKFELPRDQRFAAAIHGKVRRYSSELRRGLAEGIALVGSHPSALSNCPISGPEHTAVTILRDLLKTTDWVAWASLDDVLPTLSEAAPGSFLDAVDWALKQTPCPFDGLFSEEGDGLTGWNYMSGVLWALETSAWQPAYLTRTCVLLAQLAERDPGGSWANRPLNSLTDIFLPWHPQTTAAPSQRMTVVEAVCAEAPVIGWKLLLSLLPHGHSSTSGTRRPSWRESIPGDWSSRVTNREYWDQVTAFGTMAVDLSDDKGRMGDLLERFDRLPPDVRQRLLTKLSATAVGLSEGDRSQLWETVRALVRRHRRFSDAQWAMGEEDLTRLDGVIEDLAPEDPVLLNLALFSSHDFDLLDREGEYNEQMQRLDDRRREAVGEVLSHQGLPGIERLATEAESSWRVGWSLGAAPPDGTDATLLPRLLSTENDALSQFASGYVASRFREAKWAWVDGQLASNWESDQVARFLLALPFEEGTWGRASKFLGAREELYWHSVNPNPYQGDGNLIAAVEKLVQHGRPKAAVECIHRMQHDGLAVPSSLVTTALLTTSGSQERFPDPWTLGNVIKALQATPDADAEQLRAVEWAYLSLLDGEDDRRPLTLERSLATDPRAFCEVVGLAFRPRGAPPPEVELSEREKSIAQNAYSLLDKWSLVPGTSEEGLFNSEVFSAWLDGAIECSEASGCFEVAMQLVGHVLVHSPPDPGGLWIHRGVAARLNESRLSDMREGYRIALYNSRGVYYYTGGEAERGLAAEYQSQAASVEAEGFHRVATTLRELAQSYERQAEMEVERHERDP